ncbi:hypothetical protein Q7P37_002941 [Cladosporium fusiforme]
MGLFNRPTSTAPTDGSPGDDNPQDIFSHSNSYSSILAEQERRRKEKAEKQKGKKEGKRKSDEGFEESPRRGSEQTTKKKQNDESPKRRRISGHDIGGLLKKSGISVDLDVEDEEEEEEAIVMEPSNEQSESPRKERLSRRVGRESSASAKTSKKAASEVIELGESSDDEAPMADSTNRQGAHQPAPVQEADDESDEELAELARQARQRRIQPQSNSGTPDAASKVSPFQSGAANPPHTDRNAPTSQDAPVKFFISSPIANTKELIVYRKLSQNLKEIRLAYCKRQGFDETFTQQVFFIHRMRRVYDVTTCRSLGLDVDAEGNITMKGAEGKDGVEKVALELVTEDIFNQMRNDKAKADAKRTGQWDPEDEADAEDEAQAAKPAAAEYLGLVLKAKDKPDFRLRVKPVSQQCPPPPTKHVFVLTLELSQTTPFSKIMSACRKTFHVAEGADIKLEFDGETLDADEQVKDTEISDLDIVNVHIS